MDGVPFKTRLERSQHNFHIRMMAIYEKYDRPFEDDIVVSMEDLAYDTPRGRRRSWIGERLKSKKVKSEVVDDNISDTNDRQERKRTVFTAKPFSGETSTALMEYKKENSDNDDCKGFPSTPYSAVPNNFINMNNKQVLLKSPRRSNVAEASFSRPGNATIEELYPQMIVRMNRARNINFKNRAAGNVRSERHQLWCKNKMEAMKMISKCLKTTIRSAPNLEDTVVASGHMFHHSPGSQKSYNSGRNAGSPKTHAWKRICQKDNN
ncbi:uncharacterized protein ACNLHF_011193 isoform 1-T1 [Anomaloglossus baeobatrachus]|uniref:uncharacterized protein LOC142289848 isoform X1 n=1 Tax=Anomaloglossus baeobatrachus TaxID=238106 RepID=UPI003F5067BA